MNLLSSSIASLTITEGSLNISSGNSVGWRVVAEGSSISRYEFALSCVANALRLILYMDSGGDINKDGIKMVIEGTTIAILQDSLIEYRSSVIGYTRIGYEGDGKGTAKGLHVIYYIFPNTTYIQLIKLELYSEHGYPRLYTDKSLIEPVNITMFY